MASSEIKRCVYLVPTRKRLRKPPYIHYNTNLEQDANGVTCAAEGQRGLRAISDADYNSTTYVTNTKIPGAQSESDGHSPTLPTTVPKGVSVPPTFITRRHTLVSLEVQPAKIGGCSNMMGRRGGPSDDDLGTKLQGDGGEISALLARSRGGDRTGGRGVPCFAATRRRENAFTRQATSPDPVTMAACVR